jgi:hypothetical protein
LTQIVCSTSQHLHRVKTSKQNWICSQRRATDQVIEAYTLPTARCAEQGLSRTETDHFPPSSDYLNTAGLIPLHRNTTVFRHLAILLFRMSAPVSIIPTKFINIAERPKNNKRTKWQMQRHFKVPEILLERFPELRIRLPKVSSFQLQLFPGVANRICHQSTF